MPDNGAYLVLGLAVTFGLMLLLIGSMVLRYRSLLKDEQTITQLLEDDKK